MSCWQSFFIVGASSLTPRSSTDLVAQGDPGRSQARTGLFRFRSDLPGVVELRIEVKGMVLLEHPAELRRDPLGKSAGDPGTDADHLDRGNTVDPGEYVFQAVIRHHQGIPAGEEDVPQLGMLADVVDTLVDLGGRKLLIPFPHHRFLSETVPAVGGATVPDAEGNAVRINLDNEVDRGMFSLLKRIGRALFVEEFFPRGHALDPDGAAPVSAVH